MKALTSTLLVTALALPALSNAQERGARPQSSQFDYTYVELSYDESDFDVPGPADEGDGFTVSGSFEIKDQWHAYAAYTNADLDAGINVDTWAIGVGYVFPLKSDVDLYGRVLYINSEVDLPGPASADEDGLGLQFRARAMVTDELEVEGGIQYVDVGNSDTSLHVGGRYYFTDSFSAGLGLNFAGDNDSLGINARFQF